MNAVLIPSISSLKVLRKNYWSYLQHVSFLFRALALVLFICAMARPQHGRSHLKQKTEGLDIILAVDTSGSMKAMDFVIDGKRQDRLFIVKQVLRDFIQKREDDRIGIVVFGTNAFAQAPLTLDHEVLDQYVDNMKIAMAGEKTAIGDAIAVASSRLKDLESKSKLVILLTDGANSAGKVDPEQAAEAARALGVKVYTIGIGSDQAVPFPTPFGYQSVRLEMDTKLLQKIAKKQLMRNIFMQKVLRL